MPDEPTSPAAARDDRDLYCLQCGYNLRGLSGDPRRCPECGHMNPLGDIELPAELITAQLRKMESAPNTCVIVVVLWMLIGLPPLLIMVSELWISGRGVSPVCACFPMLVASALWLAGAFQFRKYCEYVPGWLRALLHYHVYALAMVVLVFGLILGGVFVIPSLVEESHSELLGPLWGVSIVITFLLLLGVIFVLGPRVRSKLKGVLDPMQRETAVWLARDALRRRLDRRR